MSDEIQRPANNDDRDAWRAYWQAQGMPWRTEAYYSVDRCSFH